MLIAFDYLKLFQESQVSALKMLKLGPAIRAVTRH